MIQSYADGASFGRVDVRVDPSTGEAVVVRIHPPQSLCESKGKVRPTVATCESGAYEGAPVQHNAAVRAAIARDLDDAKARRCELVGVALSRALSNRGALSSPAGDHCLAERSTHLRVDP